MVCCTINFYVWLFPSLLPSHLLPKKFYVPSMHFLLYNPALHICALFAQSKREGREREKRGEGGGREGELNQMSHSVSGSCADIMHSAQPFRNGFKQEVIAVILRDVVQGLDYLHNLGYVHR